MSMGLALECGASEHAGRGRDLEVFHVRDQAREPKRVHSYSIVW